MFSLKTCSFLYWTTNHHAIYSWLTQSAVKKGVLQYNIPFTHSKRKVSSNSHVISVPFLFGINIPGTPSPGNEAFIGWIIDTKLPLIVDFPIKIIHKCKISSLQKLLDLRTYQIKLIIGFVLLWTARRV